VIRFLEKKRESKKCKLLMVVLLSLKLGHNLGMELLVEDTVRDMAVATLL